MPGCGKSTIARHLSRRLDWPLADADLEIERRIHMSIRQYFELEGESRFRDLEHEVIDALSQLPQHVLATGGGAILRPDNRQLLKSRCTVVYLRSSPEELFKRLRHDTTRPLLQGGGALGKLRELHRVRDPLYREVADFVIETGRPSVHMLVNMIMMQLELA
jgi:shikimate kinase